MDAGGGDAGRFWSEFARDPRLPDNQGLRAGDRDRDVVRDAISEAFADGRLRRDEMDERLTQVQEATRLGDLMPIVADLVPSRETAPRSSLARAGASEIDRTAREHDHEQRRRALTGMLVPSLICLIIWVGSMVGLRELMFPWPIFVILGTGAHLFRLVINRESALEEERERLRKKQVRALIIEQYGAPGGSSAIEPTDEPPPDRNHRL